MTSHQKHPDRFSKCWGRAIGARADNVQQWQWRTMYSMAKAGWKMARCRVAIAVLIIRVTVNDHTPQTAFTVVFCCRSSRKSLNSINTDPLGRVDVQRAASIPGFDNTLDDDCGICLDSAVNVGISGCSHKLCVDCATRLCQVSKKPPLCPFCRIHIESFYPISVPAMT